MTGVRLGSQAVDESSFYLIIREISDDDPVHLSSLLIEFEATLVAVWATP
jgi:hypothetical protein